MEEVSPRRDQLAVTGEDGGLGRSRRDIRRDLPSTVVFKPFGDELACTGKTHISIALGIRACLAGQRVLFRTATEWVARLADAQRQGKLDDELARLERIPLLVCDEVGYIPFDPQAASLMFMLVSRRYERASMIVTSNKPFSAWGEIFGDDMAATAMVDRLIHHAEILSTKGTQP